jgi:hypothetical protein
MIPSLWAASRASANRQIEQRIEREGPERDPLLQGDAAQQFHRDEGAAIVLADVVDRADVRVIERAGSLGFALEALERAVVAHDVVGQKLQRDGAAQPRVLGTVHHAHPAAAELIDHAVVRNRLTNQGIGSCHCRSILDTPRSQVNVPNPARRPSIAGAKNFRPYHGQFGLYPCLQDVCVQLLAMTDQPPTVLRASPRRVRVCPEQEPAMGRIALSLGKLAHGAIPWRSHRP